MPTTKTKKSRRSRISPPPKPGMVRIPKVKGGMDALRSLPTGGPGSGFSEGISLGDNLDSRIELKEATRVVAAYTLLARERGGPKAKVAPVYRQALRQFLVWLERPLPSYAEALKILAGGNGSTE